MCCLWWFRLIRDAFHIRISADALSHTRRFDLAQIDAAWCVRERLFILCHHGVLYAWRHFRLCLCLNASYRNRTIHQRWRRRSRTIKKIIKQKNCPLKSSHTVVCYCFFFICKYIRYSFMTRCNISFELCCFAFRWRFTCTIRLLCSCSFNGCIYISQTVSTNNASTIFNRLNHMWKMFAVVYISLLFVFPFACTTTLCEKETFFCEYARKWILFRLIQVLNYCYSCAAKNREQNNFVSH